MVVMFKKIYSKSHVTHILKKSNPYTFILKIVNNPTDEFCTHILFDPEIILIFSCILYMGSTGYLKSSSNG